MGQQIDFVVVVQLPGPPWQCEVWLFDIEAIEWKLVVVDELHGCKGPTHGQMDGPEGWKHSRQKDHRKLILNDLHVLNAVSHSW